MRKNNKRLALLFIVIMTMAFSSIATYASSETHLRSWPLLKQGHKGTNVRTLQYLLISKGFDLCPDGDFGGATRSAVKRFQELKGLKQDGIVGKDTWSKLIVLLRYGDQCSAVKGLQYQLRMKYGYGLTIDADFGPRTELCVKDFQRRVGVVANGEVGHLTWYYLISGSGF
ncbi:peptidoglycan-binding protein [Clostridiaceae bacterium M8S5]|nr:peptidoglycan-binding protein [Clostridiaceae bacterium M8S5]